MEWWGAKYKSSEGILDSLKQELRSQFHARFIQGRDWRARNTETGEIVDFPEIENYYK
jgi:hypothetical protein